MRVVPGVELSVRAPSGSLHLLGYFREQAPEPLRDRLEEMRRARETRRRADRGAARRGRRPRGPGRREARARGARSAARTSPTPSCAAGHARDRQDAFDRYLHDGGPAAVPHEGLGPEEAVRLVRDSGGAPALAHPASLRMAPDALSSFVGRLAQAGLGGIEVHRADHTPERRDAFATLARRHGLVPTGGSDFHRLDEPLRPGDTGDPPLPLDAIERLLTGDLNASEPVSPRHPAAQTPAGCPDSLR